MYCKKRFFCGRGAEIGGDRRARSRTRSHALACTTNRQNRVRQAFQAGDAGVVVPQVDRDAVGLGGDDVEALRAQVVHQALHALLNPAKTPHGALR